MLLSVCVRRPAARAACFLSIFWAALAAAPAAQVTGRAADYPPPVQPASPEAESALKRFRVAKGLKVELVAAEPLLANPVAFTQDEHGRFYVVETFRLHAGVTDIRQHMDWLDEELAVKTVKERVAYMTRREGKRIADYTKHSDRLRLVWDADGDGRADQAAVLADGFNGVADGIAAGVLARRGEVYFANIPSLWKFTVPGLEGAGVSLPPGLPYLPQAPRGRPRMENLATGFGIRVGFLGHDLHGLCWGPDGRIYYSIGDRGAHVRTKEGGLIELHETGGVFRSEPDGSNLELYATGLRNPQELVFDEWGNLWTGDNNSDGGDPARWVQVVEGGDSGWRIGWQFITSPNARGPWLSERMCYPRFEGQGASFLPPLALIGNGPSGLTYHPGTGLNDSFRGRFFLCDFRGGTGSGIHQFGVRPKGASFEVVERAEFIWDVLVTDGDFGPDGSFYLTDWVNGWNQTGKGRIYRVFDPATRANALHQEVQQLLAAGFARRPAPELAALLAHPDQRVRREAQFALAARVKDGAVDAFTKVLHSGVEAALVSRAAAPAQLQPRLARVHAVWGLGQVSRGRGAAAQAASSLLVAAVGDADPEVRGQAAKALGDITLTAARAPLVGLLRDPEPRVRSLAAIALGRIGGSAAVPALVEMLRAAGNDDPYLRHAGVMGLLGCAGVAELQQLSADPAVGVRLAAVVALRRRARPEVADFLRDNDPLVVLEAARAIHDLPIEGALSKLAPLLGDTNLLARQEAASRRQREQVASAKNLRNPKPGDEPDVLYAPLLRRVVNAHFRLGGAGSAMALADFAASGPGPDAVRAEAIGTLANWAQPSGRDAVTGLWRPLDRGKRQIAAARNALKARLPALLQGQPAAVEQAVLKTAASLAVPEALPAAFAVLADTGRAAKVRAEALQALVELKSPRLDEALSLALADQAEAVRTVATRVQAKRKPGDATAQLRSVLAQGGLREKQAAYAALATLPGSGADTLLAESLDQLLAGRLAPELHLDLLAAAGQRQAPAVQDRLARFERARPANDDLRSYRECLSGGSAEEGRRIFRERADVFCLRCHKVNGEGGDAGPDLTGIGAQKSREYLLEAILYPNRQIAQGFESVVVTLQNGATYAGTLKKETDTTLDILSPEDGPVTVKKSEIQKRERGPSAMPEELRQILGKQDIRHLIEFLGSLK
ncbi:MAG: hypothetical protein RJA22_1226 [Verrucomicrobiota bacterium]